MFALVHTHNTHRLFHACKHTLIAGTWTHRMLRPEEKSQALHNKTIIDERITVLEDLDFAMEVLNFASV